MEPNRYTPGGLNYDTRNALAQLDQMLAATETSDFEDELCRFVRCRFDAASRHRRNCGVEHQLVQGAYAYRGEYSPGELAQLEPGTHIYIPVTQTKCRAAQNWLNDILSGAVDRPFTLTPTPVPDIPPHLENVATERLYQAVASGEAAPEDLGPLAETARRIALDLVAANAKQAADGMAKRIEDQLSEGGWRDEFDQLTVDISHMPAAVLLGPIVEDKERVRWVNGQPRVMTDRVFSFRRISPFDFYPSPGATSVSRAPYVILRDVLHQDELDQLAFMPGYNAEIISALIARYPHGNTKWYGVDGSEQARQDFERKDEDETSAPDQCWHILRYFGKLPVRTAMEYGIEFPTTRGYQGFVEVEIDVCAGYVLRAVASPYPARKRPIYVTGFQRRPGSVWFDSLPWVMRDVQRGANAAMRALVKNMALSAGPVVEADVDRLQGEEDIEGVVPYRVYKVTSDPLQSTPSPALRFNQMQSNALHLLRVWAEFSNMADEVSGIPAYVAGNPNVAGAGRTLGGLSMLMGNAAKGIKRVIGLSDNCLIQPVVEMMYVINMLYLDDDSVKADAQVVARGAAGLLQRELSQSRALELLNILLQPVVQQQGIITPATIQTLLRDIAASMGYDPDLVGNQAVQQQLMTALQTAGIDLGGIPGVASGAPSETGPAVPQMPQLDGRSQPPVDPSSLEMIA